MEEASNSLSRRKRCGRVRFVSLSSIMNTLFILSYHSVSYMVKYFRLNAEIVDFFNYMTPKPEEHAMRNAVIDKITKTIKRLWPAARVSLFFDIT